MMRQSICSSITDSRDMYKVDAEQKNIGDPMIDSCIGLEIWIVDHFHCEVSYSEDKNIDCA